MRVNFQDPVTSVMEGIISLHHSIMFYLIVVVTLVAWMLLAIVNEYGTAMYVGGAPIAEV